VVLSHYSGGRVHKTWWNDAPTPGGAFSALVWNAERALASYARTLSRLLADRPVRTHEFRASRTTEQGPVGPRALKQH
jgi:hypothetical protein